MNNLLTRFGNTITNNIRATTPLIHSNKSPHFAQIGSSNSRHLYHPSQPPPNKSHPHTQTSHCLLFHLLTDTTGDTDFRRVYMLQHEDDDSFENGVLVNPRFETFALPDKHYYNLLVGSCNGLVLLGQHHNDASIPVHICNPVTREYVRLPEAWTCEEVVSGLGFDDVANEYKVVRIMQCFDNTEIVAEVLTLGSGEWRILGNYPYPRLPAISSTFEITQVFVNGALHWWMGGYETIIAFDVHREEFGVVPCPPRREGNCFFYHLKEIGGYLCCVEDYISRVDIWVMKEHGVKDSWTKEWVIPLTGVERIPEAGFPLRLLKNGSILLHLDTAHKTELISYDPVTKTLSNLGISKSPFRKWCSVTPHAKSCVSLKNIVGGTNGNLEVKVLEEWQLKSMDNKPLPFED